MNGLATGKRFTTNKENTSEKAITNHQSFLLLFVRMVDFLKEEKRRIIVRVSDVKHAYEEDVTEETTEYFNECKNNGANPWLNTFESYTRPIKDDLMFYNSLDKYNKKDKNNHFIYGWWECFSQSDNVPLWMDDAKSLTIEVIKK